MKTPDDWKREWRSGRFDSDTELFEAIQKDALSSPLAQTTDQQELELAQSIAQHERIRADQLHEQLLKMTEKWHEARRYLRQANRGAERNAIALQLAMCRLHLREKKP